MAAADALAAAQRAADDSLLAALDEVRAYRNVLVATTAILIVALVALPLVAARLDTSLVTIVVESNDRSVPIPSSDPADHVTWQQVATIEFWGSVGATVGMLVALRRLRTTAGPFGLYAAQAALKVPAGALVALLLILLLQSGVVDQLQVAGTAQLAAFAALFGFAEEAATRFVDRRAAAILDRADPTADQS